MRGAKRLGTRLVCLYVTSILTAAVTGQTSPPAAAQGTEPQQAALDVRRIALFSSGVGYFERGATVHGNAVADLNFRTAQINDILKSMLVLDRDGGTVGTIGYASQDPIERTLRSFAVDLTGKPTLGQLLDQLRGEPVEITGARALRGTIVGVETVQSRTPDGDAVQTVERLTLLTENGLQQLDLHTLGGVQLLSARISDELRRALATLAGARDADRKTVRVHFDGTGERRVHVAYLLEAPIWKTSYRLVLSDDEAPLLQGWATVENATEEDWNDVRLSLISGRPISFRMDLYTPLYVPRPIEQLELYASLRPPTFEGDLAGLAVKEGAALESRARIAARRPAPPPAAAPREQGTHAFDAGPGGGGLGYNSTNSSMEFEGIPWDVAMSGLATPSVAEAAAAGELFAYHIATPVTIPRQHAAMLSIAQERIEGHKVSIFNQGVHPKHPLNGLEMKNTSALHLMQGPVTVFDGNTYAGDAKLPDLKPNETRLIAYALDLGTEVAVEDQPVPEQLVSLRIAKGTLIRTLRYAATRKYTARNRGERPRTLVLEHPNRTEWELVEPKEPYERTRDVLRFKLDIPADGTMTQVVRQERTAENTVYLSNIDNDTILFFQSSTVTSPRLREALERVIVLRAARDRASEEVQRLTQTRTEAEAAHARILRSLETLDRSTDAYQRQLRNFDEVDAKLAELTATIATARDTEVRLRAELDNYLLNLEVE
ncbi:MAG: hypothetical protein IPM18_13545 [Phycisphaerales bacterium]|nr:hypothetical protein [Phycisphaerales bacterium]